MSPQTSAAPFVPKTRSLPALAKASKICRGCDLYKRGTQTVFGEGPRSAQIVMIGEQPGDQEDLTGKPFVGPAGRLLDKALLEAGLPRQEIYVTNAVKHFKFEERGKKRLHSKPSAREVTACKPWLVAELFAIQPRLVVCLGATAAQAMLGPTFKVTQQHGDVVQASTGEQCLATFHPSALLRTIGREGYEEMWNTFIADLKAAWSWVQTQPSLPLNQHSSP